jgi:hypothetical protein
VSTAARSASSDCDFRAPRVARWGAAWFALAGLAVSLGLELAPNPTSAAVTTPQTCPCSIFQSTDEPSGPTANDGQPIELGLKFRAQSDGTVTGVRFYKGPSNTGVHLGHLWAADGKRLAEVKFADESESGWQEVAFPHPIPVVARTTYIISYHSRGAYSSTDDYFASTVVNGPLRALANGEDGPNGVFSYGASAFPTRSYRGANYWVDVVFIAKGVPAAPPPAPASPPPLPPLPDQGPGGPILVLNSTSNRFGRYAAEILRAEGFNEFTATDLSTLNPSMLDGYDVVILGEAALSAEQVSMLTEWTQAGGMLIALRPDRQLATLMGLTPAAGTLSNGYLRVNTSSGPGVGIVGETIQFHGVADRYTLKGATSVATLYSNATSATRYPAVTLRTVGTNGGRAVAFMYDLARSVVYTRQGNPAWAGQERDGTPPKRSNDLFYGNAPSDPRPDWVDLDKVAIPQADEQQRLLVNLILMGNLHRKPLPRFWYLPRGLKAAVVMTGDDHGDAGMAPRFDIYRGESPVNCSEPDWECVRATGYEYVGTALTNSQARFYDNLGFEVALHVNTGCADFTEATLDAAISAQVVTFASTFPSIPLPTTNRTHCIAWSDWSTEPEVELLHGIRFDTNYYYYPAAWVRDRPGMFTGSGMPMRFARLDGSVIDCYQAATQMTDESGQTYPMTSDSLLERALDARGYYGVFTTNLHFDNPNHPSSNAIVASALARGVPVVSAKQMLTWLDGRNGSSFGAVSWNGNALSFTITVGAGARNLRAMLPLRSAVGPLATLTRDGSPVTRDAETIKGIAYAFFPADSGNYVATYQADTAPPSADASGNASTEPPVDSNPHRTSMPVGSCFADQTAADFRRGTASGAYVSGAGNGEVVLAPALGDEFRGSGLAATWTSVSWGNGGAGGSSVSGGSVSVDGGRLSPTGLTGFGAGRILEFAATFAPAAFQHVGFGSGDNTTGPAGQFGGPGQTWAMFSTGSTPGPDLYARLNPGGDVNLGPGYLGEAHTFGIEWRADSVTFLVDGATVDRRAAVLSTPMRPGASDFTPGKGALRLDWIRMSPYAASGAFVSRVYDAGSTQSWEAMNWTTQLPAGTSMTMSYRTGDTPVPDGSWSWFTPVATSGGAVSGSARYIQYRAQLATTDGTRTPALSEVDVVCHAGTSPPSRIPASSGAKPSAGPRNPKPRKR